jgi:CBS domain-containing protein
LNSLIARELMSKRVITVPADASVQSVARMLLENNIGAVPVVDLKGALVGMASDGDLLGRRPGDHRRVWWLEMLAHGSLSPDAAAAIGETPVCDVMTTPLITIDPATPAPEIARTLQAHKIKRLPVVHNGELVGIVSRTDLLGVIDHLRKFSRATVDAASGLLKFLGSLAGGEDILDGRRRDPASNAQIAAATPPALSAEQFREAVRAYKQVAIDHAAAAKREADLARKQQVEAILEQHVSTGLWRKLLDQADVAAKHGEKEFLLLRFPSDLCSDGGRMIDVAEPGWEQTLRGEAAEINARWRADLRPKGFGLNAKIVSYEDGILGDIGLFLTWGE